MTSTSSTPSNASASSRSAGAELVPSAASGGMSRRAVLGAFGLGSVGLFAGPSLLGGTPAHAATPAIATMTGKPGKAGKAARRAKAASGKEGALDADGNYLPPTPYSVQASCELSQDFFSTDEVLVQLDKGDKVMPFTNTLTGLVEAVVLVGNHLSHLRRDTTAVTGWSLTGIPTALGGVSDAAVISTPTQDPILLAFGQPQGGVEDVCQLKLNASAGWDTVAVDAEFGYVGTPSGPLSAATTPDGTGYFYWWVQQDDPKSNTQTFYGWKAGADAGVGIATASWPDSAGLSMTGAQLALNSVSAQTGYATVVLTDAGGNNQILTYYVAGSEFLQTVLSDGGVSELITATYTPTSTASQQPVVVYQGTNGDIYFTDQTGQSSALDYGGSAGQGQAAYWQLNGAFSFAVLDDATVKIYTEIGTGGNATSFTGGIPLITDVVNIFSVPTDAAEATLFAIDVDWGLSILTRSDTGWTQNVVHQDSTATTEVTTWRILLSTFDATGSAVAGADVVLTPDIPVGIWIDGADSMYAAPDMPATVTTDSSGRITLCIPAAELDTAQLSAVVQDGGSVAPLVIAPNGDVTNFLAGTGTLNSQSDWTMKGATLLDAQQQAWSSTDHTWEPAGALLPNLNGSSTAAAQCSTAFIHLAQAGQRAAQASIASTQLILDGGNPTFTTSSIVNTFMADAGIDQSWWATAQNDTASVHHGIRHHTISLKKMFTNWASDAEHWVAQLVVDIGDGIDHLMTMVIDDVKTAIHAISGFFHTLGADLEAAWSWLRHNVLDLIRDTGTNATVIEGWAAQAGTQLTTVINNLEVDTNTWFADHTADINNDINELYQNAEGMLFGTNTALPTPSTGTGSQTPDLKEIQEFFTFLTNGPANWLLNKIKAHLPSFDSDQVTVDISVFEQPMLDLVQDITDAADTIGAVGNVLYLALKDSATSPSSFSQADLQDLFTAFETMVDDGMALLDELTITVLDLCKALLACLDELLSTEISAIPIPLIGDLLELCGVNTDMTIMHLIALVLCFPATLAYRITQGDGPMPFPTATPTSGNASVGTDMLKAGSVGAASVTPDIGGFCINILAACIQGVWAIDDFAMDWMQLGSQNPDIPELLNILDFVCPMFQSIITWPVPPTVFPTPCPYTYINFDDSSVWGKRNSYLGGIIATGDLPWIAEGLFFTLNAKWGGQGSTLGEINNYVVPFVQSASGICNNVISAMYSYANADTAADKADAIISATVPNLSYTDAFLGTIPVKGPTDDLSAVVKLVIDTFGNFGAVAIDSAHGWAALAGN
jgi:hypothetical protein